MAAGQVAEAKKHLEDGELVAAKTKGTSALIQLRDAFDSDDLRADAAILVVTACLALGDLEEAGSFVTEELSHCRKVGHQKGEAHLQAKSLELAVRKSDGDEALRAADQARALSKKLADPQLEAEVLQQVAKAHLLKGQFGQALSLANDLLASAKNSQDKAGQAAAWIAIADVHFQKDEDDAAPLTNGLSDGLHAARKALTIFRAAGNKKGEARALCAIASALIKMGSANEALVRAKEAKAVARDLGDGRLAAEVLAPLVEAQSLAGNAQGGRFAAMCELDDCRSVSNGGDKRREAIVLESVSAAYAFEENYAEAVTHAKRAVELWADQKDTARQAAMSNTLAGLLQKQGKPKEAVQAAESAKLLFKELGSAKGVEKTAAAISDVYVGMGQPFKAPNRKLALQALTDLASAAEARDAVAFTKGREDLEKYDGMFTQDDMTEAFAPLMEEDRHGVGRFLKEQRFLKEDELNKEGRETEPSGLTGYSKNIWLYEHQIFYGMGHLAGGVVFGPQFRSVHPARAGKDVCICAAQLPECEDWQYKLGLKPGILDAGFQQLQSNDYPPYY